MAAVAKCSLIKKTSRYDRLTTRPQTYNLKIPLPPSAPPPLQLASSARTRATHTIEGV